MQRIDGDQLLHDVEVDRVAVALHDETVGAPHALGGPHIDLAVGENGPLQTAEPDAQEIGHLGGQRLIGATGEEHQAFAAYDFHPSDLSPDDAGQVP